jgi:hypothetical protein
MSRTSELCWIFVIVFYCRSKAWAPSGHAAAVVIPALKAGLNPLAPPGYAFGSVSRKGVVSFSERLTFCGF